MYSGNYDIFVSLPRQVFFESTFDGGKRRQHSINWGLTRSLTSSEIGVLCSVHSRFSIRNTARNFVCPNEFSGAISATRKMPESQDAEARSEGTFFARMISLFVTHLATRVKTHQATRMKIHRRLLFYWANRLAILPCPRMLLPGNCKFAC